MIRNLYHCAGAFPMAMTPTLSEKTERPLGTSADEINPVKHQHLLALARPVLRRAGLTLGF